MNSVTVLCGILKMTQYIHSNEGKAQYGQSQSEQNRKLHDKPYRSIKVHNSEAMNLHQLIQTPIHKLLKP